MFEPGALLQPETPLTVFEPGALVQFDEKVELLPQTLAAEEGAQTGVHVDAPAGLAVGGRVLPTGERVGAVSVRYER